MCSQLTVIPVCSVDTYQSHEQKLYCKPHFKELFQPKAVENVDENGDKRIASPKAKLQLIICESQPKELPPDVVRGIVMLIMNGIDKETGCEFDSGVVLTASDVPTTGLEDMQIDVRSKFEMFEGLKEKKDEGGDKSPEMLVVKR